MTEIVQLKEASDSVLADIHALQKQLSPNDNLVTADRLENILKKSDVEIWVTRDEARVVGMATLLMKYQLQGISAYVEDVVVDDEYRGQGLGKALMEKLIERARAHHAGEMRLTSKPSRVAANKLYQKLGFKLKETNPYRLKL